MIEDVIRAAAARGWKLILIHRGEKNPVRKAWQKHFPTLEEALEHARRGGNIGVVTGAISGIVVVDLDTYKDEYRPWPGFDTELKTLRARSPQGGMHFYFAAPDEPIKCAAPFAGFKGVDIKGDGGYILLPGSTTTHGAYEWINDLPLAPFPLNLYHATKTPLPTRVLPRVIPAVNRPGTFNHDIARKVFCEALCSLRDTPIGGRNVKLNHAAFTLGGYAATGLLSRAEVEDALLDAALRSGLPQAESEKTIKRSLGEGIQNPFSPLDEPSLKEKRIAKRAADQAQSRAEAYFKESQLLSDLAEYVRDRLNDSCERASVEQVGIFLSSKLDEMDRLLWSTDGTGYLLDDDGVPREIDIKSDGFGAAMACAGLSRKERAYPVLCDLVREAARKHGKKVTLHDYAITAPSEVLVSCGPGYAVQIGRDGSIQKDQTSTALFRKHFPEWNHEARPVELRTLPLFAREFETPPESEGYTSEVQHDLLQAWLSCTLYGVHAPMLTLIGGAGSGKSTFAKALSILLIGDESALCAVPSDPRNLQAMASKYPLYGIDNLDNHLDRQIEDVFAAAVTRTYTGQRALYTNDEIASVKTIANFMITTRTVNFIAKRKDLADRTLPLYLGTLKGTSSPRDMFSEVLTSRDKILASLAICAPRLLDTSTPTQTRFSDFEKLPTIPGWVPAWRRAQSFLAPTPLVTALEIYMKKHCQLTGSATQIITALRQDGARGLDFIGQGRAAVSALREALEILHTMGSTIEHNESTRNGGPYFRLKSDIQTYNRSNEDNGE